MKTVNIKTISTLMATVLTTSISGVAVANNNHGNYIGIKGGKTLTNNVDVPSYNVEIDKPTVYGVYAGMTNPNHFGFELEYLKSAEAKYKANNVEIGKINTSRYGGYVTYNFYPEQNSSLYLKGKLGYTIVSNSIKNNIGTYESTAVENGVALGVGVGYDLSSQLGFDVDYTYSSSGQKSSDITAGLKLKF